MMSRSSTPAAAALVVAASLYMLWLGNVLEQLIAAPRLAEPDVVLDVEKTRQLVGEIEFLLSESKENRSKVTPGLVRQL